jgi:hypothetical protein
MNRVKRIGIALALSVSLLLFFSQTVYASVEPGTFGQSAYAYYIDPGTGSIIIQVLIGAVVGGMALIGVYRARVKNFFTNLFSRHRQDNESGESKESGEIE